MPASQLLRQPDVRLADADRERRGRSDAGRGRPRSRPGQRRDDGEVRGLPEAGGIASGARAPKRGGGGFPADFPFARVPGLSREVVQRLSQVRPETLGQASRIPGVTPAAVAVLGAFLGRLGAEAPPRRDEQPRVSGASAPAGAAGGRRLSRRTSVCRLEAYYRLLATWNAEDQPDRTEPRRTDARRTRPAAGRAGGGGEARPPLAFCE